MSGSAADISSALLFTDHSKTFCTGGRKHLASSYPLEGLEEMVQWLRAHSSLAEDLNLVSSTHNPNDPRDLTPCSGLFKYLYSDVHTHVINFFSKKYHLETKGLLIDVFIFNFVYVSVLPKCMSICASGTCVVPKKDPFGLELYKAASLHVAEGIDPRSSAREANDLHY